MILTSEFIEKQQQKVLWYNFRYWKWRRGRNRC